MMVKVLLYGYATGTFSLHKLATKQHEDAAVGGTKLTAITQGKRRLEQRQREADAARGRSQDDERKPRDKNGRPKSARYKRDYGVPKNSAQESFADSGSRIMKRSGEGYDAHTAVDEAAQIVVAAELSRAVPPASGGP